MAHSFGGRDGYAASRNRDAFSRGADLLATVAGFALTFITAPPVYRASIDWARFYTIENLGSDWLWLVPFLWGLGCAVIVFAIVRMVLAATVRLGFAALASRIFR